MKSSSLHAGPNSLNCATLHPTHLGAHSAPGVALAFRPDGRVLASSSPLGPKVKSRLGKGSEVKLWDVELRQELCTLHGHRNTVTALAFSPDGTLLLTASQDGAVGVWDVTPGLFNSVLGTRIHTITNLKSQIVSIAFHPDGRSVIMADAAGKISILNTSDWRLIKTLGARTGECRLAISPNGSILAAIWKSPGPVSLWHTLDWEEQEPLRLRREDDHDDLALAFSSEGALAVLSADEFRVWDLAYRQVEFSFATESCRSLAYVSAYSAWALGGWDSKSSVCGWLRDRATGAIRSVIEAPGRPCAAVAASRAAVAAAHADFTISLWSADGTSADPNADSTVIE